MRLTDKEKNKIDGNILLEIAPDKIPTNHWMFKTKDWRYGFDSMSPDKASRVIGYILNEHPTDKQRDLVKNYIDIENDRKINKSKKFRSELLVILKLRTLLFGYKSFPINKDPLYKKLKLAKSDVYDHVKSSLIEYLINLGFKHITTDSLNSGEALHSPTVQKKPFSQDFDHNKFITEQSHNTLSPITTLNTPKNTTSYWFPPLLNLSKSFDALYTTFSSLANIVNTSIKISIDIVEGWHNYLHQDILEPQIVASIAKAL